MKTIYIVDDVLENLQVLGNILTDHGYNIAFARNGSQAIMGINKMLPDLILLDIAMPEMDGFEVCKKLKTDDQTKDIPIIFLTAKIQSEDIVKGFQLGAVDYVTKPYNKEELLARVNTHLELKETREKLGESNSTKDKFFSIIAHDLKNPLAAFRDATEVLVKDDAGFSNEDRLEFLTFMNSSAKQLYGLLENLLDWSRSQTGKINYNPDRYDISVLLNNNRDLLNGQAAKKNITLKVESSPELFAVIDANMITTVIRNLTSNAIKFTPDGGEIILGAEISGRQIRVSVKDNGVGISEEDRNKLFRIDEKHSTLGTSNETGTGLGLILCREFVEKHEGKIWVESVLNEGTTFKFLIPASQ